MTMEEAEYIYGYPSNDKEDVMKRKTVITWKYLKQSNKMDREVIALELKFENDELVRYIDKRDNTNWSDELEKFSDSLYVSPNSPLEILTVFLAYHSIYPGEVSNDYETIEDKCFNDLINDIINRHNEIIENINYWKSKRYDFSGNKQEAIAQGEEVINSPIIDTNWNKELYSLPKFENGIKLLNDKVSILSENEAIKASLKNLKKATAKKQKKEGGCFIATATMGSYDHPTVLHLREFRDDYLLDRTWGITFTEIYYRCSPYIAKIIQKNKLLKLISHYILIKPLTVITKYLLKK